jgi:DNA-binding CsgD family transcriptional regulator
MVENSGSALTAREFQCLAGIARGLLPKQIAGELGLADVTVHLHVANAKRKLGARTREHAVAIGVASGLIAV